MIDEKNIPGQKEANDRPGDLHSNPQRVEKLKEELGKGLGSVDPKVAQAMKDFAAGTISQEDLNKIAGTSFGEPF